MEPSLAQVSEPTRGAGAQMRKAMLEPALWHNHRLTYLLTHLSIDLHKHLAHTYVHTCSMKVSVRPHMHTFTCAEGVSHVYTLLWFSALSFIGIPLHKLSCILGRRP